MKRLNLVNHTHWDREWYESFDTYRGKLVEAVKLIIEGIENGQFDYFMLDGQTVILEDLEEVLEEKLMKKLLAYIEDKKIEIGPWYVLPDEFLVSGESLIRNLEIGIDISKELGVGDFIGYLPDTFGHIGQLPQIFKGLGIKWALLFRGLDKDKKTEVNFIGSDGSNIKTLNLPLWTGYYNHFLSYDNYKELLEKYLIDIERFSNDEVLLLNGADHLIPIKSLKDRCKVIENDLGLEVKQINLKDYCEKIENLNIEDFIYGEQRKQNKAYLLPNVLSSRTYLKVENQRLEEEITAIAEPMEVIKSLVNQEYRHKYFNNVWKSLLKNHPHDSICGCSIDKVHKEMETRNIKIGDMLKSLEYYSEKAIIHKNVVENNRIYIFNPHPYEIDTVIRTIIQLPCSTEFIKLFDEKGENIPVYVINKEKKSVFKADVDLEPNWYEVDEFEIVFPIKMNGIGYTELSLENGGASIIKNKCLSTLENKYISVSLNSNGYLDVLNRETNYVYRDVNKFISTLDAGDTYTYSPPYNDVFSQAKYIGTEKILNTDFIQEMVLLYEIEEPVSLNIYRDGPAELKVKSLIKTKVSLAKNSKTIEFVTEIDSKAKDRRLRVMFPIMDKVHEYFTDVSFDKVLRKPIKEIYLDAKKQKEVETNCNPTDSFVEIKNHFGILHLGLQEVEVTSLDETNDCAFITLIRSVGWLSRDDIRTRGGGAGPKFITPDAQCIGKYTFMYGITFNENIAKEAKLMRVKPRVTQGVSISSGLNSILKLDNDKVLVSAFYKNKNDDIILRIYNLEDDEQKVNIIGDWESIYKIDLAYNKHEEITDNLVIKSKEIITLCLKKC